MRHPLSIALLATLVTAVPVSAEDDPYLWLEEVEGEEALARLLPALAAVRAARFFSGAGGRSRCERCTTVPPAMSMDRSIRLRNCRTLPGQS